eukprot:CAMPEP_0198647352 /NCGR_PEP_ID=MMETSP1467-20131203/2650_1 /TAXON_ID=1462469 /ORGANISM="unid. sp., Strain CCMP2135" /LENGTH=178 /DNA_ID=CAMNT_0044382975 /DNA_START=18 /DNA_END=554 /DNA_ORIENTATION=-
MSMSPSVETENKAVLVVLSQADEFYREQQRLAKALRKGFLDLAKARSAAGPSTRISALDCREEIVAQFAVDGDTHIDGVDALEASQPWRAHSSGGPTLSCVQKTLRRRGSEAPDAIEVAEEADAEGATDTVLLFTALAPPALRKAKKEFVAALSHVLKLANASQRIQLAEAHLHSSLQ